MAIFSKLKYHTLILSLLMIFSNLSFRSQEDSVMYSSSFRFETGIYLTYEEFKNNNPAIKAKPIKSENVDDQILFGNIFQSEKIGYNDSLGVSRKISRRKMWGYSDNGAIYIRKGRLFHRVTKIGSLTHFARSNNSNWSQDRYRIVKRDVLDHQFIFYFPTGGIFKYELYSFMAMISDDKELSKEFMRLKDDFTRKRNMFIFLNKYNERNPIYFLNTKNMLKD